MAGKKNQKYKSSDMDSKQTGATVVDTNQHVDAVGPKTVRVRNLTDVKQTFVLTHKDFCCVVGVCVCRKNTSQSLHIPPRSFADSIEGVEKVKGIAEAILAKIIMVEALPKKNAKHPNDNWDSHKGVGSPQATTPGGE